VIVGLETERVQLPLRETFRTAIRETDFVEALRVQVNGDNGEVGVGYGTATPAITGDTLESMEIHVETIGAATVTGRSVDADLFTAVNGLTVLSKSGTAALDLALHDMRTDGSGPASLRTSVTISAGSAGDMIAAALRRIELGFGILKLKLGLDPDGDVDRLQRVTDVVEGRATIWVDANQGWGTVEDTMTKLEQAGNLGCLPVMLEQPVKAEDRLLLSEIAQRSPIPVFADESVQTIAHIEQLADLGYVHGVNVKFMKFGGLTGSQLATAYAHDRGLKVLVGSMMEHPASVAAAIRFAASLAEPVHDLDAAWWFKDPYPVSYKDSYAYV
jgi:L-Ala-D/L-Glu epimerase